MEWTREKTLLLISEYRQRRGLWDMTCDEYRKKDVKQKLLNEVSEVLGGNIPIPELEKKFHTLRTQYHREISRMKRKEPYNSKWFGFKNLVFLSSPYACRSTKGRLKTDLQSPENAAIQKYVLGEVTASSGETNTMNEEYIINHRKSHANSRAQELEKLIEETTKDVDDIEEEEPVVEHDTESKPKVSKEMSGSYVHINEEQHETLETHHQQHAQQQPSMLELHHSEAVSFQANESGELHYQSSSNTSSGNGSSVHVVPTRIIKIQRRETTSPDTGSYYEDQLPPPPPPPTKRLYFDPNCTHSTTILSTSALQNGNAGGNVLTTTPAAVTGGTLRLPRVNTIVNTTLSPPKPPSSPLPPAPAPPPPVATNLRDEFSTYGEYVANEMRAIGNREVLIALKHKINTAIFEANMAEYQK